MLFFLLSRIRELENFSNFSIFSLSSRFPLRSNVIANTIECWRSYSFSFVDPWSFDCIFGQSEWKIRNIRSIRCLKINACLFTCES